MNLARTIASLAFFSCLLMGCALAPLVTGEAVFSYADLGEKATKRFPQQRDVAGLVAVKMDRPRFEAVRAPDGRLDPERRLRSAVDIAIKLPLTSKEMTGVLSVTGLPVINPQTNGIHFRDPKVERVRIDNMPDALSAALARVATSFAQENYADKPVYVFKDEDLKRWGFSITPLRAEVREQGLVLMLR